MNISLFGGSFDPPHLAHQSIASYLIDHQLADQVWFVPVYKHPWANDLKKNQATSYSDRLAMIQLLANPQIQVKEFKHTSFVYPTITHFQQKYPNDQFSWVMGSEYLPKFELFLNDHPKLIDTPFLIYPRLDHPFQPTYPNMTMLEKAPLVTISSTEIRNLAKQNKSIQHLVPFSVFNYIFTNNLYL